MAHNISITGSNNDSNLILSSANSKIEDDDDELLLATQNNLATLTTSAAATDAALTLKNNDFVEFMLNGKKITVLNPDPETTLINYLRDNMNLTGTKVNCNQGFCGVCTVMVSYKDGLGYHNESMNSCLLKVVNCHGKAITTIEGIKNSTRVKQNTLHPIQQYFLELGALQCGYCTAGFEMRMYSTFQKKETLPTFASVENNLSGNLCRCTGYRPIIEAYKCLLIAIVEEERNGVSKGRVTEDISGYDSEYDRLKDKWQIGKEGGLSSYNLDDENRSVSGAVTEFLTTTLNKLSTFKSSVYDNYTFKTPTTLVELDAMIYAGDQAKTYFLNGVTSLGVPKYEEEMHTKSNLISLKNIGELYVFDNAGDYVFGAGVTQNFVAEKLAAVSDLKYQNMAANIEYVSSATVRNLASWAGSLMMTIKNGFRGDWATMLAGAKATFTYDIYSATTKTSKVNQTYPQLVVDVQANNVVLLRSVKIPKLATGEVYSYQRSAVRMQNSQSIANVAISATKTGSNTYSQMLIAVGALDNSGVQFIEPTGGISSGSISSVLTLVDTDLDVVDEYEYVGKPSNANTVREIVKGFIIKFMNEDVDLKLDKVTNIGYQTFNTGDVTSTENDYNILDRSGSLRPHLLIEAGGISEDASNNPALQNRDQLEDIVGQGKPFNVVGKAKPQRDAFAKVQGNVKYASEMISTALHCEIICSNFAKGTINFNSEANKNLIKLYREYEGVESIILNDEWFNEQFLDISSDEYLEEYVVSDALAGKINLFNNAFFPVFTDWKNMGQRTKFTSSLKVDAMPTALNTNVTRYGQVFGMVVAKNIHTARFIADKLTNGLVGDKQEPQLTLLDASYNFSPDSPGVLTDDNTMSRIYSNTFANKVGLTSGYTQYIKENDNKNNYIDTANGDIDLAGQGFPGFYSSKKHNYGSLVVPNCEKEKRGAFFVGGNNPDKDINLKATLGEDIDYKWNITPYLISGISPYTGQFSLADASMALLDQRNGWMNGGDASDNYKTWREDYSGNFGNYGGLVQTESQHGTPMEGTAFTLYYRDGRNIECFLNTQDNWILTLIHQALNKLAPKFKSTFYDASGNYVRSVENSQFDARNLASGGSFGSKFWYAQYARIELAILATIHTRQPVKYMEYWKYAENNLTGRGNFLDSYKMSLDASSTKISLLINDVYTVNDYHGQNSSLNSFLFADSLTTGYKIDDYASRVTLTKANIGETGFVRAIMEAESLGVMQTIMSRASAILKKPQYEVVLNSLIQFDGDERATSGDGLYDLSINNMTGTHRDPILSKELVFKELEIAILKNLTHKESHDCSRNYYPGDGTTNIAQNSITKDDIKRGFERYYEDAVTNFNATSKFVKRGMSLIPQVYLIPQSFVASSIVGLSVNSSNMKLDFSTSVKDYGTGSYQNGLAIVADYLKLDEKALSYNTNSVLANNSSANHAGSTAKVSIGRASLNAGRKFMQKLLEKYPKHAVYAGDTMNFMYFYNIPFQAADAASEMYGITISSEQVPPTAYANLERWFVYPKQLVERGIVNGPEPLIQAPGLGPPEVSANIITIDTYGTHASIQDASFSGGIAYQDPNNADNYMVDLRLFSGKQLVGLYNQFYTGNDWSGRLVPWNWIGLLGLGGFNPKLGMGDPSYNTNVETIKSVEGPDLHRELIVRTLELEYAPVFTIPQDFFPFPVSAGGGGRYGLAKSFSPYGPNGPSFPKLALWTAGENGYVWDIPYYQQLVEKKADLSYKHEITTEDMMNRWPMILNHCLIGIVKDAGPLPAPIGLGSFGTIDGIQTGVLGGECLGECVGGKKNKPLTPEIRCGEPVTSFEGALTGYFSAELDTLSVEGHGYESDNWYAQKSLTTTWGFDVHSTLCLTLNLTELDVLTGEWVSKRTEIVSNVDRSINPLLDIGQLEGGYAFGVGYWTSENVTNIEKKLDPKDSGKRIINGHWNNKLPTAKTMPEVFNATLLNRVDAYRPGLVKQKGVGEVGVGGGNSVAASIRDAVRNWREKVSHELSGSGISDPFADDTGLHHEASIYMDKLCHTYTDRIRTATTVDNAVLEKLLSLE
jgi:xanthine dehydrogenase iron-sulfur cluster and FAD-binding subunit A